MTFFSILVNLMSPQAASWWESFGDSVRKTIGPPIRALHHPVDQWLSTLSMNTALICAVSLLVIAGIWVWTLRKEFILRGAPGKSWRYDLLIWATLVLLPYIGVYLLFGL